MWKFPVSKSNIQSAFAKATVDKLVIGCWILGICTFAHCATDVAHDIVIYGSSPAAISAAVQAKRMGKTAVVVSPEKRIGGLTTGGLGQTDIGNKSAFGGIALEFYRDVAKWYADPAHWTRQTSEQYKPEGQTAGTKGKDSMWTFEPSAALAILEGWEKRDQLDIRRNEWLDRAKGVEKKNGRIVSIKTLSGNVYRGKVFIDATYEGDLMAAAGVSYTVGREANSVYGETISGIEMREARCHQLQWYVSPYVVEGNPESGLLPGIEPYNPDEKDGDGDKRVQAYNFRMCLTDDPENRIPFKKPANYNELEYELLFRNFAKGEKSIPWNNCKMPNRKTDTNNNRGFSTDFIGRNYEWPEASFERRAEIFKAHLDYQQGLMWTLANHPRVPEHIRAEVSKWGTCKDEFLDGSGDGWQTQLYVREARRMVGDYVMTEHECRGDRTALHPVAMGAYTMDSHNVRRVVTEKGNAKNEGDVQDARRYSAWGPDAGKRARGGWMQPYGIDYGAITPKRAECENLLVPVCLSASHMAFGSIRMEPVFFALGQAAGTAASLAVADGAAVQEVPYGKLATRLKADGQVLPAMAIAINPSASVGRVESRSDHEAHDTGLFGDFWWANRFLNHHRQIKNLDGKTVDLVMVGDAITHSWETHKDSWAKFTKGLTVFNLGYRGDATYNLIWRIEHGELKGYKAKCIVLMIGTNNNWHECADPVEVAEAIKKIVGMIRERQPQAKIVLHPIFPRGNAPGSPRDVTSSARNKKTNELIAQFAKADGKIVWIDFNDKLVDETGWVPKSIMPDGLNPSDDGYDIWMKALAPITDELRKANHAKVMAKNAPPVATAECQGNAIKLFSTPLAYEVVKDGKVVVPRTEIGLRFDGKDLGEGAKAKKPVKVSAFKSSMLATPVYKKARIDVGREEWLVDFGDDFAVRLAARPDGVAYRFELKKGGIVEDEKADITIPKNARCWFNRTSRKAMEGVIPQFADARALKSEGGKMFFLPFAYSVEGKTVAVTDTDVHDYPVWNLGSVEQTEVGTKLKSYFAKYPKSTELSEGGKRGRFIHVKSNEDFIAKSDKPRTLPWRVFALADSPSKLCEADISYALATPTSEFPCSPTHNPRSPTSSTPPLPHSSTPDFSWVKPGKVAWDWWNAFDNKGDPQGCTTETYVRFIDFAAANGVEYVIFDEGWSANLNIWKFSPKVNVPYLIDYANKKGVGIILWMAWAQAYGDEEHVVEHFAKLGAKGFKVDFMDRGDGDVYAFLEKFAAACVKHKMVVDYHGSCRPAGLHRTYPNILNFEAIHGLEQMKWAKKDKNMCPNDVSVFFLRMTDGPMDYTPGAMDNYPIGDYRGNGTNPGSVGTRCHQMALMALYEAPLQMLADSPTKYEKNMECFSFMAKTPVVWDATVGLGGCPETYAAVARKAKDGSWYAAAISNRDARDIEIDTSFLGKGDWKAEIFRDADDADKQPTHYVHETRQVKAGERLTFHAAPGGGFVIRLVK